MSRKFVVTAVLILFLLPLVSWYYLKSGLKWRQAAQSVMSGTQPFPSGDFRDHKGSVFTQDNMESHVSLMSFIPCHPSDTYKEVLDKLYDQFKESGKANFIFIDSCAAGTALSLKDDDRKQWYILSCTESGALCNSLVQDWPAGKPFALVDRKGIIRSYYAIEGHDERKILTEHMALLLPRERQEKVELKRGQKQ